MKTAIVLIKIALSILLIAYLVNKAIAQQQFASLTEGQNNYAWLAIGAAASVGAHFVGFFRWYLLSRALGLPLTLPDSIRISLIGCFFGLVAFGVVGTDSLRAFYAVRQSPGRRMEAVAAVFVDRLLGLLTMFLFAFVGYFFLDFGAAVAGDSPQLQAIRLVAYLAGLFSLAGISALLLVFGVHRLRKFGWFKWLSGLPLVGKILQRLVGVAILYRSQPQVLVAGFGLSGAINLLFMVAIFFAARFVSDQHPTLIDHVAIAPISMVANAVPLPGGVGGMEAVLDFMYQVYAKGHEQTETGVVVALVFRALLLIVAALGVVAWLTMPAAERETIKQLPANSPEV